MIGKQYSWLSKKADMDGNHTMDYINMKMSEIELRIRDISFWFRLTAVEWLAVGQRSTFQSNYISYCVFIEFYIPLFSIGLNGVMKIWIYQKQIWNISMLIINVVVETLIIWNAVDVQKRSLTTKASAILKWNVDKRNMEMVNIADTVKISKNHATELADISKKCSLNSNNNFRSLTTQWKQRESDCCRTSMSRRNTTF